MLTYQNAHSGTYGESGISTVEFLPVDSLDYTAGASWEGGRQFLSSSESEYDNLRFSPLDIHYGFSERFQFSSSLRYSSNSGDTADNSGLESLNLRTKYKWNRNFAVDLMVGFGLSDDVFPYGGDGALYGLNFPFQVSLGPGYLIGDLGFTVNDGSVNDQTDWASLLNYGIGYRYQLTRKWGIKTEIFGHGATLDPESQSAEGSLEIKITPSMRLNRTSELQPSLTLGFADGSPDFGMGVHYTVRFGEQSDRRVRLNDQGNPIQANPDPSGDLDQSSDQTPQTESDRTLILPEDSDAMDTDQPERNPQRAQTLSQKGRTAFEEGDRERALSLYEEALQFNPKNVQILSNLGSLHYREGNLNQAEEYYRKASKIEPNDQYAQLYLGIVLNKQGNTDEALQHLKKARRIDPTSEPGKTASNWIDQLQE